MNSYEKFLEANKISNEVIKQQGMGDYFRCYRIRHSRVSVADMYVYCHPDGDRRYLQKLKAMDIREIPFSNTVESKFGFANITLVSVSELISKVYNRDIYLTNPSILKDWILENMPEV